MTIRTIDYPTAHNPSPIGPGLAAYLHDKARANGGVTWNIANGRSPRTGFAVAISKRIERIIERPLFDSDIEEFCRDNSQAIAAGNLVFKDQVCLGLWKNEGKWYLDLSIACDTLDEALTIGRQSRQLAVYDLANGKDVRIDYDETQPTPVADHPWA